MRYKAFILLICTLAFVTECVAMAGMMAMPPAPAAASARSTASHEMCCSETKKSGAPTKCPKESKEANCCLDCPMCYTTIMTPNNEVSIVVLMFKTWYPGFQSSYVFGYSADS